MGKSSKINWEDVYFDGLLKDEGYMFDEETEEIVRFEIDDGWDKTDKIKNIKEKRNKGYIEDYDDEWYMNMKQGKIKRR